MHELQGSLSLYDLLSMGIENYFLLFLKRCLYLIFFFIFFPTQPFLLLGGVSLIVFSLSVSSSELVTDHVAVFWTLLFGHVSLDRRYSSWGLISAAESKKTFCIWQSELMFIYPTIMIALLQKRDIFFYSLMQLFK